MTSIDIGYPGDTCRVTHQCDICGRQSVCLATYSHDVGYRTAVQLGYEFFMDGPNWHIACQACQEFANGDSV